MKLSELYWHRITPLHFLLWPLSVLYRFYLTLKKLCYWLDIIPSVKLPVPVIMVDSISVDDSGKTPLIIWLIDCLLRQGYYPAIIARGDSDNPPGLPTAVTSTSDPHSVGGKTFLLAQRCGKACPVWVGDDRIAVAQVLLDAYPACNIIICNDGMHYYRLERDIEIAVVDFTEQSFGNGLVLPAGPLKANLRHLEKIEIIVTNGKQDYVDSSQWGKTYNMKLVNETAYNVLNPEIRQPVADFKSKQMHAIASEDNMQWFFDFIQKTGLNAELHSFAENHRFIQQDIHFPETDVILMPEENALEYRRFAKDTLWALPQEVWVDNELQAILLKKLKNIAS